ncbi:MAG TPA: hypothetical protein VHB70_06880 [Parafilimonas sp.]|nr:hypothetical protein [Parafilimonas sp.]
MENHEQLRAYYDQQVKEFFDPAFDQLTNNQIKKLQNSWGFTKWKFTKAKQPISSVIKKSLHLK